MFALSLLNWSTVYIICVHYNFNHLLSKKECCRDTDVYAPIAHRLGFGEIKTESEDLSFSYLYHDKYYEIAGLVDDHKQNVMRK